MKRGVVMINGIPPVQRRAQCQHKKTRAPPALKLLDFQTKYRPTMKPHQIIKITGVKTTACEKRLADAAIDFKLNAVLRMSPNARTQKFNTMNINEIRQILTQNAIRKMRRAKEVEGKQPIAQMNVVKKIAGKQPIAQMNVVKMMNVLKKITGKQPIVQMKNRDDGKQMMVQNKVISPRTLLNHILHTTTPIRTIVQTVHKLDTLVKRANDQKQLKPTFNSKKCGRKSATNPGPYTVKELRQMIKGMGVHKNTIDAAKSSRVKLCEIIEKHTRNSVNTKQLKRPIKKQQHVIKSPTFEDWMSRSAFSRRRHTELKNDVYIKELDRLKKTNLKMYIKELGFNTDRVSRKTKTVPDPYGHRNLMNIATKMNLFIHGQKSKYTPTELIKMIKGKL